jgi:hypothetical protein
MNTGGLNMAGDTTDFFSSKHKKLLRISTWANILAWIALIVYALITLMTILEIRYALLSLPPYQGPPNQIFLGVDLGYLEIVLRLISRVLSACYPGIVFWLVLKGISVGLEMIAETDINHRVMCEKEATSSRTQEQTSNTPLQEAMADEDLPIFYEPGEVWKIEYQLSRLAIFAVFIIIITNIAEVPYVEAIIRKYWMQGQAVGYLSWLIAIVGVLLVITIGCKIAYYAIHALASILNILMDMEHNYRGGGTS